MMTTHHSSVALLHTRLRLRSDGPNYCTEAGAHLLKKQIENYWHARGYDVTIGVHEMGFHPSVRAARFELRSNMINGEPRLCLDPFEASPTE